MRIDMNKKGQKTGKERHSNRVKGRDKEVDTVIDW